MIINYTCKDNGSTYADVVVSKTGNIMTNLWDHRNYYRVAEPALKAYILSFKKTHTRKAFQAWSAWRNIRDLDKGYFATPIFKYEMNSFRKSVMPTPKTPTCVPAWLFEKVSVESKTQATPESFQSEKPNMEQVVSDWMNFFSEFQFTPQVRFLNAIGKCATIEEVKSYVIGYFSLTNNSYQNDISEKMKSAEFTELAKRTINQTKNAINERLEIYYGEPGSGKTTTAIKENPNSDVVICHNAMDPDELFRGFDFNDGKPMFKPCPVKQAMIEGKPVILDEINLLNEDCRRALQAVTDAKELVTINNEKIHIKKGFKVVGTMNLKVDEQIFGLPAPLVDRACKIKLFKMTAKQIAKLAF